MSVVKIKSLTAPNMLTVTQNVETVLTVVLSDCVWLIAGSLLVALWIAVLQLKFHVLSSVSLAGCNGCKLTFVLCECEVKGNVQGFIQGKICCLS